MSTGLPPLVPGELAWECDVVRLEGNRVGKRVSADEHALEVLRQHARRLYLDVAREPGGRTWLVHRAGWPFALRAAEIDPAGAARDQLRPTGAGDEVMRDLIEAFEAEVPGFSLHVHGQRSG